MINYAILQMPISLWHSRDILFTKDSIVDRKDYCHVYRGKLEMEKKNEFSPLDHLFELFNLHHPENYAGRSMSGGDVVMLEENGNRTYYLCCSFGWHKLENFSM